MTFKINADEVITSSLDGEFPGGVDLTVYTISQLASKSGSAGDIIYVSDSETKLVYHNGSGWVLPNTYEIADGQLYNASVTDGSTASDAFFTDGDKTTGIVLVSPTSGGRPALQCNFPTTRTISKMVYGPWGAQINGGGWGNKAYGIDKLEYWNGSSWVQIGTQPLLGTKPAADTQIYTFSSVSTTKVKMSNNDYLVIAELYFE